MLFHVPIVALLAGLSAAMPRTPVVQEVCSTPACNRAADYIRNTMNESANPCDDFYEYSCGGWVATHTIPPTRSRTGLFDSLSEQMEHQIKEELYAVKINETQQSQAVRLSAHLFHKCLDVANEHDNVGWDRLESVYRDIFTPQDMKMKFSWDNLLGLTWSKAPISPVFQISIAQDPKNNKKNVLMIDPQSLGLGEKELANPTENAELITAYKKYMHSVADVLCKTKLSNCTDADIAKDVEGIVNLETELSKIRLSPEDRRDPIATYNKFTLDELKKKTNFDWEVFFNRTITNMKSTKKLNGSFEVLISDVNYVVKAVEILKKADERTISSYFFWSVISDFGSYASEEYRKIKFNFDKVNTGVKQMKPREKFCQDFVYLNYNMALSQLFVSKHFTKQEKAVASDLINTVQDAFKKLIVENEWLDEGTRKLSIAKLEKVIKNVGYPDWLLVNSELDDFYNVNQALVEKLLLNNNYLLAYLENYAVQMLKKVEDFDIVKPIDKSWPMPPAIINAAYEPQQNSITIPAGILKFPFFDAERLYSINYGLIGVVIGHEFTHGLDDQGSLFDAEGNLNNWWTDEAHKAYQKRAQCFIDEYAAQVDPLTGLHLNGKNTLGENIADNGGLKEAYNAFKTREAKENKEMILAGVPNLNSDKLFFVSFGQTWCSLSRLEAMKSQILYDPHSAARFRVQVPTYNNDAFHKAFNCPVKSTQPKCQLW